MPAAESNHIPVTADIDDMRDSRNARRRGCGRFAKAGLALLVLALLAAHYAFWYLPRERSAAPDPDDLPGRLFAGGAADVCLWLPYPHQNAGALQRAVGDWPAWLGAASRVAGLPPPALPAFGPFALPPSRELTACSDLDGGRLLVAARVYPVLGLMARAAGRLAGNPWLAGGRVEEGERTLEVAWDGGLWTVRGGAPVPVPERAPAAAAGKALAALRLEEGISRFPPGTYLLRREQGDLVLRLAGAPTPPFDPGLARLPRGDRPLLLAATESAAGEDRRAPAAMALYEGGSVARFRLPGIALFQAPGREGWRLPGGRLGTALRGGLPAGEAAGWRIVAMDRETLRRAERLAPHLAAAIDPRGADGGPRLGTGVWAEPRGAYRLVQRVRDTLEELPLVRSSEVQRWRDWETVLEPFAGCEELSLVSTEWPGTFRLRLAGCR